MDPRKDFNISGNRIINVADPEEFNHVATKHYVDHLHDYNPVSNVEEYVRYINNRNSTLHGLAGLCKLEMTFRWATDPKHTVVGEVGPYIVHQPRPLGPTDIVNWPWSSPLTHREMGDTLAIHIKSRHSETFKNTTKETHKETLRNTKKWYFTSVLSKTKKNCKSQYFLL